MVFFWGGVGGNKKLWMKGQQFRLSPLCWRKLAKLEKWVCAVVTSGRDSLTPLSLVSSLSRLQLVPPQGCCDDHWLWVDLMTTWWYHKNIIMFLSFKCPFILTFFLLYIFHFEEQMKMYYNLKIDQGLASCKFVLEEWKIKFPKKLFYSFPRMFWETVRFPNHKL